VVFGGMGAKDVLDDTWVYDVAKNRWFRLSTSSAPSARYRSAITYDPAARKVIMFGGRYSRPGYQQDYSDTWALDVDGQTWTELHPAGDPPDVSAGTAVLVPDRQSTSILLLAGIPPLPPIPPAIPKDELLTLWSAWSYEPKNDVWTSLGTETGSPTISQYYCAAYDSALEQTMVFGGLNLQNGSIGDMWVHEGRGWESPAFGGAGTPQPHIDAGMVFDLDTKRVILFGRSADGTSADVPAQTWAYTP